MVVGYLGWGLFRKHGKGQRTMWENRLRFRCGILPLFLASGLQGLGSLHDREPKAQPPLIQGQPGALRHGVVQAVSVLSRASPGLHGGASGPTAAVNILMAKFSHICKMQLLFQALSAWAAAFCFPHGSIGSWTQVDMCPHEIEPHPLLIHLKLGVPVTPAKGPALQVPHQQGKLLLGLAFWIY